MQSDGYENVILSKGYHYAMFKELHFNGLQERIAFLKRFSRIEIYEIIYTLNAHQPHQRPKRMISAMYFTIIPMI